MIFALWLLYTAVFHISNCFTIERKATERRKGRKYRDREREREIGKQINRYRKITNFIDTEKNTFSALQRERS